MSNLSLSERASAPGERIRRVQMDLLFELSHSFYRLFNGRLAIDTIKGGSTSSIWRFQ